MSFNFSAEVKGGVDKEKKFRKTAVAHIDLKNWNCELIQTENSGNIYLSSLGHCIEYVGKC